MPQPIRIAHVVGNMDGGVESVLMNYYRHIDRDTFQFDFFVNKSTSSASFSEIEALGGRLFMLPGYANTPRYIATAREFFRSEGYKIVHSHQNTLSVFPLAAAKQAGVPIRIAHNHTTSSPAEFARNTAKLLLRPYANEYPTHRLACSQHAGRWLFGTHRNFEVVYNAIDLDDFSFKPEVRKAVREEFHISPDTFVVGYVGRLVTQKNLGFLINVFSALQERRPNSLLFLIGDGPLKGQLMNHVQTKGLSDKVRFLGRRKSVSRYMQAFDLLLLTSHYEGLGIVGVEAQASGLPCLLSSAISPEVDLTGNVRFMALDSSIQEWVEALLQAPERIEVNRTWFTRYDIQTEAPKLERLYQSMLDELE